jgi:hypothetical protein
MAPMMVYAFVQMVMKMVETFVYGPDDKEALPSEPDGDPQSTALS